MGTRRERLERKIEKRKDWAKSRDRKSAQGFEKARAIADNTPMGQPILVGHHSEGRHRRDLGRMDSGMRQGCESADMAKHHRSKAAGLADQLENSIYSDDHDATTALRGRIAEKEALRDRMKLINGAHKRYLKVGICAWTDKQFSALTDADWTMIGNYVPAHSWEPHPIAPYQLTNLGASIRTDKKRIEEVERQAKMKAEAEAAGGLLIGRSTAHDCASVRFSDKPDYSIIKALKAADFHWSGGAWHGSTCKIPQCVLDLEGGAV